jgi:hypothetical protein
MGESCLLTNRNGPSSKKRRSHTKAILLCIQCRFASPKDHLLSQIERLRSLIDAARHRRCTSGIAKGTFTSRMTGKGAATSPGGTFTAAIALAITRYGQQWNGRDLDRSNDPTALRWDIASCTALGAA